MFIILRFSPILPVFSSSSSQPHRAPEPLYGCGAPSPAAAPGGSSRERRESAACRAHPHKRRIRDTGRQAGRQVDRKRQTETETEREAHRETEIQAGTVRHAARVTDRQRGTRRQAGRGRQRQRESILAGFQCLTAYGAHHRRHGVLRLHVVLKHALILQHLRDPTPHVLV